MAGKQGDDRQREAASGKTRTKESKGMANSLIKGLALTLGGGLAVGLGIKIGQGTTPPPAPQETIDFGPVLDRIEGVENRIDGVEDAQAALAAMTEAGPMIIPSVQELEARVQAQSSEVEALRAAIQRATERHDARIDDLGVAVTTLESRIPGMIDVCIKPRFEELHDRVQREMQETASQTLEMFADRIQARVVEKITSIEGDLGRQSEAINDLRDYSLKTDQNLQRLLAGVENLADKINRKFEAPVEMARQAPPLRTSPPPSPQAPQAGGVQSAPPVTQPPAPQPAPEGSKPTSAAQVTMETPAVPEAGAPAAPQPMMLAQTPVQDFQPAGKPDFPPKVELGEAEDLRPLPGAFQSRIPRSFSGPEYEDMLAEPPRSSRGLRRAALIGGGAAVMATVFGGIELTGVFNKTTSAHSATKVSAPATAGADMFDTRKLTEQSDLLDQATAYNQKKDYGKAEEIYRKILKSDPSNTEVKRKLASVLFREDKIEESAQIIRSLDEDKGGQPVPNGPQ